MTVQLEIVRTACNTPFQHWLTQIIREAMVSILECCYDQVSCIMEILVKKLFMYFFVDLYGLEIYPDLVPLLRLFLRKDSVPKCDRILGGG